MTVPGTAPPVPAARNVRLSVPTGKLEPEVEAPFRPRPGPVGEVLGERLEQRVSADPQPLSQPADVSLEAPAADELVHGRLAEQRGGDVGRVRLGGERGGERLGEDQEADPETGRDRRRERRAVGGRLGRDVEQRGDALAFEPRQPVGVVFEQDDLLGLEQVLRPYELDESAPALEASSCARSGCGSSGSCRSGPAGGTRRASAGARRCSCPTRRSRRCAGRFRRRGSPSPPGSTRGTRRRRAVRPRGASRAARAPRASRSSGARGPDERRTTRRSAREAACSPAPVP